MRETPRPGPVAEPGEDDLVPAPAATGRVAASEAPFEEDAADDAGPSEDAEPDHAEEPGAEEPGAEAGEAPGAEAPAETPAEPAGETGEQPDPARPRRRRDPLASALIGLLTLLLGFAFAVQVRNTGTDEVLAGAREEDLVRILDDLNARENRLREQIAEQRSALEQLTSSDSQSATALAEARKRATAIGILNGTIAARGQGITMTVRDPDGQVRVADILDAIQELRGAGAETMQIDGVRVGVSTAVTGEPGRLLLDGHLLTAPYDFVVIGDPQYLETAMNIPGGAVQRISGRGGSVTIRQSQQVVVDALRPLDVPQYASPSTGG